MLKQAATSDHGRMLGQSLKFYFSVNGNIILKLLAIEIEILLSKPYFVIITLYVKLICVGKIGILLHFYPSMCVIPVKAQIHS